MLMAFKGQKKGLESADGTNVPNSFYDFTSELREIIFGELRIAAEYFGGDNSILPTFTINTKYQLVYFYAFKMVISIAFLRENAVERF
jgi:hypothetical protein